jgi:putative intracellular protease/amidase
MTRRKVGILVFPEVEVLDFCGPFEVFSVTRLDEERRRLDPSPYEVLIIAENPGVVVATGGLKVIPDHVLEDCPPLDVLVVPGGWGTRREMKNDRLIAWIAERGQQVTTLTSVCTGSLLLGKAGLLDGRLACLGGDARIVPGCQRDRRSARRRGGQPDHLGGDLGGHRYGAAGGRQASRRCSGWGDCQVHGVPVPGGQPKAGLSPIRSGHEGSVESELPKAIRPQEPTCLQRVNLGELTQGDEPVVRGAEVPDQLPCSSDERQT